jgi:membrane-associated phospholipid phosphatase
MLARDTLRQAEIVDQVSSARYSEILHPLGITDPANAPATAALIDTVLNMTERVGYVYKRKFGRARPNQVATHLRPFLGNPAHESYPSNHSFQMFSVAEVMTRLMPELPATVELFHVAQRVAENREMAGIHYASDSMAGRELARMFAPYLIYACRRLMRDALSEWGA